MYIYRLKIQAINDELANFIGMMTDGGQGEDGEDEGDYSTSGGATFTKDESKTPFQIVQGLNHLMTNGSLLQRKALQQKFKRIMRFLRTLDSELTMKQQLLDKREHVITKLTREKSIL